MNDDKKTKPQLIAELQDLRRKVEQMEAAATSANRQTPLMTVAESAASAIFIFQDSLFRYTNPATSKLTGYAAEELLGTNIWELVHPEHRELIKDRFRAWQRGEPVPSRSEFKILTSSGEVRWIDADSTLIEFDGSPAALTIASEAKFRVLGQTIPAVVIIFQDSKIVYANSYAEAHSGYTARELRSMDFWEMIHPDHREIVKERGLARLRGEPVPSRYELKMITKSGEERWVDFAANTLEFEGRRAVLGAAFDITDRKKAEETLRKTQERLRHVVAFSPAIIYLLRVENDRWTLEWLSDAVTRLTGHEQDEALVENWWVDHIHPDDRERVIAELPRLLADNHLVYEYRFRHKDGRYLWLHDESTLLRDDSGRGVEVIGSCVDVSERRDSQERFHRYFDLGLIGMAITSPTKRYLEVNDQLCKTLGYERSELLQMTWAQTTHPDDLVANIDSFNRVFAGETDGYSAEKRYIRKDGRVVDAAISVKCLRRGDGSVDYFVALTQDITARKQAEQALRESQSRLQAILDYCPSMIFLKDADGRYLQSNRVFERTFNMAPEDYLGRTDAELFPPDVAAGFGATDRTVLLAGRSVVFEEDAVYDNELHTYLVHKFPLRDASGNVYAIGGISTEITERKRAEDALRKQKESLQSIFDHIPVMIGFRDEKGSLKLVNQEWQRILGWTMEELLNGDLDLLAEAYPDPAYRQSVVDFISGGSDEWVDFKTRAKDGRLIDTTWLNLRLADGTNLGIGQDITERKRANELLRRQAAQLAALHEIELEISAQSDLTRVLEVVTRRAAELLGASHCSAFIRERDESALTLVAATEKRFVGLRLDPGEGLAGRVFVTGEAESVVDYSAGHGRLTGIDGEVYGPSIAAPLKWQQTAIGVISLSRLRDEDPFTVDDLGLLKQLAAEASIAIHQATLFDEVQESQRRLQILSRRLIDAQEAERKRIARELHDQIGQALTAVQINLQAVQSIAEGSAGRLDDCLTIIDDALQQVHDLSLDLRPSLLDDLGLEAALRWYIDRVASRAGLVRCFEADVLQTRLASQVETACFRIAQEALTNVLRHAHASTVWVQVKQQISGLQLVVKDDGLGFDVRTVLSRKGVNASLGLQGMQERAAALGGTVDIKSHRGKGVEVRVSFPLV